MLFPFPLSKITGVFWSPPRKKIDCWNIGLPSEKIAAVLLKTTKSQPSPTPTLLCIYNFQHSLSHSHPTLFAVVSPSRNTTQIRKSLP
jgi:hypothetical protein